MQSQSFFATQMEELLDAGISTPQDTETEESITRGDNDSQKIGLKNKECANEEHQISNSVENTDQQQHRQSNNTDKNAEESAVIIEENTRDIPPNNNEIDNQVIGMPGDSDGNLSNNQHAEEKAESDVCEDMDTETYR